MKDTLTPDRGTLSIEKARRCIGYSPEHPIERGYARYINWCREFSATAPEHVSAATFTCA